MLRPFLQGFRWGVATSGHQTEGGNTHSDSWFLEQVRPSVFGELSGQACNSYQLWREDVDLLTWLSIPAPVRDRRPKPSAAVYAAIARSNGGAP